MATHTTSEDTQITDEPTMVLSGISKSYAGVAALTDVSLEILPGEIHALLGENGAGKSTLMGVAAGETAADAGTITFAGSPQPPLTPKLANSLGIAIVHQHPALLPDMTVAENILLAVPAEHLAFAGDEEASMRAVLDEVGMNVHLNDRASTLSIANQHLLEVAKALAVSPKVLILDEPTAPLGKESVDLLFEHVRTAAAEGTAVVYITHRLAEVRLLADRVTVLRDGKVSGTAKVDEVSDDQLLAWIVGRRLIGSTFPEKASAEAAEEYVKVSDLSGQGFSHISVTRQSGRNRRSRRRGRKRSKPASGGIGGLASRSRARSTSTASLTASSALRTHAAYMPADRHREGLMMSLSVRENAAVSALQRFRRAILREARPRGFRACRPNSTP